MRVDPSPSSQSASPSRAELSTASCESSRAESKNASSSQVLEFSRGKDKKNKAKSNQPFSLPKKVAKIFFFVFEKNLKLLFFWRLQSFLVIFFHCELEVRVASQCEPAKTLASQRVCELESGSKPPLRISFGTFEVAI